MRTRAMRGIGGHAAGHRAAHVGGHPLSMVQHLDHRRREAGRHPFADERVRHTVEVLLDGDVIVDVRLRRGPLGEFVACGRQRPKGGTIGGVEQGTPRRRELLEGPVVDPLPREGDGVLQLGHRVKDLEVPTTSTATHVASLHSILC